MVAAEEPLRTRSTLLLLLLAVGLGAYAYFVERPAQQRESQKATLLDIERDAVEDVNLTYSDREIHLEKSPDGHWHIVAPLEADADQQAVKNLVDAIVNAEVTKTIDDPGDDLSPYGFDNPTVTITLKLQDGTKVPALIVGDQTPIGFKAYARKEGDPKLYLTTGAFHSGVKKELKDVRDKTILSFTDDEVQAIALTRNGSPAVRLERNDGQWSIAEPAPYKADPAEVRSFLSALRGIRAQDFVDAPEPLRTYGLDSPRLAVTLSVGKDQIEKSVQFGGEVPGASKQLYAKQGARETIYLLGDWALNSLDKDVAKFRDRTVLSFADDAAASITITRRDRDPFTLERPANGSWTVKGTTGTPKEDAITRFVADLQQTKPHDIVSDHVTDLARYGLDDPDIHIAVVGTDGQQIGALLATRQTAGEDDDGGGGGEKYYFAREGSSTVFEGRAYLLTRLEKKASDFVETSDAEVDASAATGADDD